MEIIKEQEEKGRKNETDEAKRVNSTEYAKALPQPDIILEAERILHFAAEKGLVLRLLGGLGVWFSSPSAGKPKYARTYNDIDFVAHKKQGRHIEKFFEELGYRPRDMFNKLQGETRLMFNDEANGRKVDIFLDQFEMCHRFDLKDRLELRERALTPADLLLTKLQIVEINKKDIIDAALLILDNPLSEEKNEKESKIEKKRIVDLTSEDWGIYKTFTLNMEKLVAVGRELSLPESDLRTINDRLGDLRKAIEESPKSFRWKMRAKVGEKVRWYELPEST